VRLRLILLPGSLFVLMFPAALAPAQDASSAKNLLQAVYRQYENHGKGIDLTGPGAGKFFHSSLISLIEKDEKAVAPEVGVLDGDPICSCQDWDGIWDLKIAIETPDSARAIAAVSFSLFKNSSARDRRSLEITLAVEKGQWHIYNVLDKTDPHAPFGSSCRTHRRD
jgi:hypothetical protein